ncbi:peptide ligase PGM1-related protein [Streptomyces sp. NPDC006326]|uniref:preATP grasp domain-containing protein n=1 Tax=Streptomyces sp. NPDC006326 TaxID=3156752 RepID=UPI0033B7D59D
MSRPVRPVLLYANLVSDLAVDLDQREVLRTWAEQAPREVWLLHPGDVLVSPVPVGEEFLAYACALTGVPRESVTVVAMPQAFGAVDAHARHHGAVAGVRSASGGRPVGAVLPTALDASAVALANALGVPLAPYPSAAAAEAALEVTWLLNTKAGFRTAARELGMNLPDGRVCRREEVPGAVRDLLRTHEHVVVKPDRSAGGHGLRFLSAAAGEWTCDDLAPVGGAAGRWVVEERIDVACSVSIQLETGPQGPWPLFSGAMRTDEGSFTGYVSPLTPSLAHAGPPLEKWGRALGGFLAEHGYAGPFSLDAMVSSDGSLFAGESNVRRTATSTPQAMVTRLAATAATAAVTASAGPRDPAWATGTVRAPRPYHFEEAVARLHEDGTAYDPRTGEGVVLYAGMPPDGRTWRYAVIADGHATLARYEAQLHSSWASVP